MQIKKKNIRLFDLPGIISKLKSKGKCVVLCHGAFDLMHPGHIKHLEAAKREGDVLVVTVTPDKYVNKGPNRPIFGEYLRAETLAALECVDYIAINEWPTAVETINLLRPDIYVKGKEYSNAENDITQKIIDEEQAINEVGGRIHFTDEITFSSSNLINANFNIFSSKTEKWLKEFRASHSSEELIEYLDKAKDIKALVIGEPIIDEYVFCDGLGKSNKDPILAFKYHYTESYAGGSLAVANHLAGFCSEVGLIALLGEVDRKEEFILNKLKPNIQPFLLKRSGAPTIHKRRFVDKHTNARLFELYKMNDLPMLAQEEKKIQEIIVQEINKYDLIVVTDYGHGMLTPKIIKLLCAAKPYLVVNTQTNAGNRGFNTISKFSHANYVCLAGHEVAIETRMRHAGWEDLLLEVTKRIKCQNFTMTMGKDGSLHYSSIQGFTKVPAFATRITDRVGAGDAVLAITALLMQQKAPFDIVGFIGNVAGAESVAALGNRISLEKLSLAKHVIALLK